MRIICIMHAEAAFKCTARLTIYTRESRSPVGHAAFFDGFTSMLA